MRTSRRRPRSPVASLGIWLAYVAYQIPDAEGFVARNEPFSVRPGIPLSPLTARHASQSSAAPQQTALRVFSKNSARWDSLVQRLREHYNTYGDSLITKDHPDKELYQWTLSLRRNYRHQALGGSKESSIATVSQNVTPKRPRLGQEKLRALTELEFPWDVQALLWERRYEELCAFHAVNGHCKVPPSVPHLGVWVRNQRREYRRLELDQDSTLTQQRLDRLYALGFEWCTSHSTKWESRYQELETFYREHGHSNVPEDYQGNVSLGQWCMNQRTAYRRYANGEPTALTAERIELLETLEFRWHLRLHQWKCMLERLKLYHDAHGHVAIPTSDDTNQDLRVWLILQRYHYNRRKEGCESPMTESKIRALESAIPNFVWKGRNNKAPSKKDWSKLFDAMRDRGIKPGMRPKQHWFEGVNPLSIEVKSLWTEQELLELWNAEDDEDEEEVEYGPVWKG